MGMRDREGRKVSKGCVKCVSEVNFVVEFLGNRVEFILELFYERMGV